MCTNRIHLREQIHARSFCINCCSNYVNLCCARTIIAVSHFIKLIINVFLLLPAVDSHPLQQPLYIHIESYIYNIHTLLTIIYKSFLHLYGNLSFRRSLYCALYTAQALLSVFHTQTKRLYFW